MNQRGMGVLEIVVMVATIISSMAGTYYYMSPGEKPMDPLATSIVVESPGYSKPMELRPGKVYEATVKPDGTVVVREKP